MSGVSLQRAAGSYGQEGFSAHSTRLPIVLFPGLGVSSQSQACLCHLVGGLLQCAYIELPWKATWTPPLIQNKVK